MARRSQSNVMTDHDQIREWAEERGAEPACVRGTGDEGDIGMLRLEFPGAPGARDESLQPISWDDWFGKFDERGLALLFQEETARGQKSNFNKLIARETASAREEGDTKASRRSGRRSTGRRTAGTAAVARAASKRKSARSASATSSSPKRTSGTRAQSGNKKTAQSSTRGSAGRSRTRSTSQSGSRKENKQRSSRSKGNVVEIRGGARSRRTASARGREGGRTRRRAA